MTEWFASGRVIDLILLLVLLEALALWVYHWRTGQGLSGSRLLPNLISGLALLAALRLALSGVDWLWWALCLVMALIAHVLDLVQRWRSPGDHGRASVRRVADRER